MAEDAKGPDELFQALLTADAFAAEGPEREQVLLQMGAMPSASLFMLSKKAQAGDVRAEAIKLLEARLREGETPAQPPSPSDMNQSDGSSALPPEVAKNRHFYKFPENDGWVLTTRSGIRVATFPSEAELDQWWLRLKRQRGRILTRIQRGEQTGPATP